MLTIKNLSKTYENGVKALNNVNLSIEKGMFGLLGPNGAGKSSLMRTIATLQEADDGQIVFDGKNAFDDPQTIRRRLGYLPQDFGVYPKISAFKLLDHMAILKGLLNKGERHEQVNALLQQTNLFEQKNKAVSTFSGGMRQRFGIAQALLGDPKLVIVDEPTAGLDPEERNRFHNLLSEIGENVVVILSTHIVEDVLDLCPNMAIMAQGSVLLEGKPVELINQLNGKIWRATIEKSALVEYQANHKVISTHLFAGQTQIHVLADQSPGAGFEVLQPGLEDVYFSTLMNAKEANHV
ncbi:MAG: ABC transporter ATP-binding protein [Psychrosphaera sp.]|nr:ABC transporter ATP-binding protein [Psychrosphaera sp.]